MISGAPRKKVTHICLGGPYTDGLTYQENILTKHHCLQGLDVLVIASVLEYDSSGNVRESGNRNYVNGDGVRVQRLPFAGVKSLAKKLKAVEGLRAALEKEKPDVLFVHGVQSVESFAISRYLKCHPGTVSFVDNHVDDSNVGGRAHKLLIDRTLWRAAAKSLVPYVEKFYGVLPARVNFLSDVYGVPAEKCDLLVMGYDDCIDESRLASATASVKKWIASEGFTDKDTILISGGKLDSHKTAVLEFLKLAAAKDYAHVVFFGSISEEYAEQFQSLIDGSPRLHYYGWASDSEIAALINLSSVCCFPGRHSVLWEQCAGQGKPLAIRRFSGYEHLNNSGNCIFFDSDSTKDISTVLDSLSDGKVVSRLQDAAKKSAYKYWYSVISRRAIGMDDGFGKVSFSGEAVSYEDLLRS